MDASSSSIILQNRICVFLEKEIQGLKNFQFPIIGAALIPPRAWCNGWWALL